MGKHHMRVFSKENGRAGFAGESHTAGASVGELDRATVVTTIRRFGYVITKAHEIIMGRLTSQGDYELAERFNDIVKPLADMLLGFELEESSGAESKEDADVPPA